MHKIVIQPRKLSPGEITDLKRIQLAEAETAKRRTTRNGRTYVQRPGYLSMPLRPSRWDYRAMERLQDNKGV